MFVFLLEKEVLIIVSQFHNTTGCPIQKKKTLRIAFILIEPSYPKKCDYFRVQRLGLFIQKQLACRAEEQWPELQSNLPSARTKCLVSVR